MNTWATYVRTTIGDSKHRAVASRLGIHFTTLSAWLHGHRTPSAEAAIEFARTYDRNWAEALVAAGYLTHEEAAAPEPAWIDPTSIPSDVLLAELGRRAGEAVA